MMTPTPDLKAAALDIEQERREFVEVVRKQDSTVSSLSDEQILKSCVVMQTTTFQYWFAAKTSLQVAEDAAKDAERLNWLLDNLGEFHAILFDGATPLMYRGRYLQTPEQLRSAIDARRLT